MEASLGDLPPGAAPTEGGGNPLKMIKDLMKNMPGIDEAMSFNELMK
jgi:anion-transporting  ArsA/GET3 family ATPase